MASVLPDLACVLNQPPAYGLVSPIDGIYVLRKQG